jgi:peroxidase
MIALVAATRAIAGDAGHREPRPPTPPAEIAPIDGSNHNLLDPTANQAGTALKRYLPNDFPDGIGSSCLDPLTNPDLDARECVASGTTRPRSEREISNRVFAQAADPVPNPLRTNNLLWVFGQFLDHDLGITVEAEPLESIDLPVPPDDPFFDPALRPNIVIARQEHVGGVTMERLSLNRQTGWIDASQVYGYGQDLPGPARTASTPDVLRELSGGRMLVEAGTGLLPRVASPLSPPFPDTVFLCGDFFPRCNETPGLTMIHTLFVREHNRRVAELAAGHPTWTDEELFQAGRRWVMSLMQAITKNEFVPAITGKPPLKYGGHEPATNGRLAMEFAHALYRVGHTFLPRVMRQGDGRPDLDLGGSLFQAAAILQSSADIDALVRGFLGQAHEKVDCQVSDGVRNTLVVDEPGTAGTLFDLPAINIARGREIGLPSYNDTREGFGLSRVASWSQAFDADATARLSSIYAGPEDVDLFAGGICERRAAHGHTGPLVAAVIHRQLRELMEADRFWYENTGDKKWIKEVERYTLAELIRNNTGLDRNGVPNDAFKVR